MTQPRARAARAGREERRGRRGHDRADRRVHRVQREAFGQRIADFQNTQFKLAELKAATVAGRVFVDRCIELQLAGTLDSVDAATAKLQLSDLHNRVVDECLQLHGGWGYMWEYPVCRGVRGRVPSAS
ncbi:MAG: acyl-CoA dehydrogenase family protein [Burkholderiaceae bacterium]